MKKLQAMLRSAMDGKKMSIRKLEAAIAGELGEEHKVSRNLIHEYLTGKRAPTYQAAVALSKVLGLDKKEFLLLTYFARQEQRKETEKKKFLEFCRQYGVKVREKDVEGIA